VCPPESARYRRQNRHGVVVWKQGRSDYLTRADAGYNDGYDHASTFRDHPEQHVPGEVELLA
jgi:hypothetical protein